MNSSMPSLLQRTTKIYAASRLCIRNAHSGILLILVLVLASIASAEPPKFTREQDIIYHKQGGFALTMDKVVPKENLNRAAVIFVVSGGWYSDHASLRPHGSDQLPVPYKIAQQHVLELLGRGYSVFFVVHGSQPKFTIREIHEQISAAVRHIRHHSNDYGIDANRIGIMGGSAGGHLAMMQGTKGKDGEKSPIDPSQESSCVQAVVDYWGPTDFLNYGADGVFFDEVVGKFLPTVPAALDYFEIDADKKRLTKVTDPDRLAEHYRDISPYYHVTKDDAPTLILHGELDEIVPLQQAQRISAKFQEVGVSTKLHIKENTGHVWNVASEEEIELVADWFDTYLLK